MFVQVGGITAANIYQAADAPLYKTGNRNLIIINVIVIVWFLFTKAYYVTKNKIRDRKWNALTPEVSFASEVDKLYNLADSNRNVRIIFLTRLIRRADVSTSDLLTERAQKYDMGSVNRL